MTDLLKACFQATGADPAMAERAALSATEPDILGLLIDHQAAAMVRLGRSIEQARLEAIDAVAVFLEDVSRLSPKDVSLGKALRQSRVYRLRCKGLTYSVIEERLGICIRQLERDYEAQRDRYRPAG